MTKSPGLLSYVDSRNPTPPRRMGQRYTADHFLPEAGNTVVCHLDTNHPAHRAVLDARAQLLCGLGANGMLFTPASSLHMTLFEGVIETRRTNDTWPSDMPQDAPVTTVTEYLLNRLHKFSPPPAFEVKLSGVSPGGLSITGATPDDERRMRAWRDALTEPFGFRHAAHDAYKFHITFAYPVSWIPDDMVLVWQKKLAEISKELTEAAPIIPLRAPAFCTFADMTHFAEQLVLDGQGTNP